MEWSASPPVLCGGAGGLLSQKLQLSATFFFVFEKTGQCPCYRHRESCVRTAKGAENNPSLPPHAEALWQIASSENPHTDVRLPQHRLRACRLHLRLQVFHAYAEVFSDVHLRREF